MKRDTGKAGCEEMLDPTRSNGRMGRRGCGSPLIGMVDAVNLGHRSTLKRPSQRSAISI